MIRATTPTNTYTFPDNINDTYADIIISYAQNDNIILEKKKSDLSINGKVATITLTQEETSKFTAGVYVQIQIKVKTINENKILASQIYTVPVNKILNAGVL